MPGTDPGNHIYKVAMFFMMLLFVPVLFCVLFIGNKMPYFDDVKADILVPNLLLTCIAAIAIFICLWFLHLGRVWGDEKCNSIYVDLSLIALFIGFYFFCIMLSREIVFDMAVDPGIVREAAKNVAHGVSFGYQYEFSMNYNNLPIIYVLALLYRLAESLSWFNHDPEYLWLIAGCLLTTVTGFCCCELVKKLTKNLAAVYFAFILYFLTAGLSPWKCIPYTDSYGILFPVLCVLLYVSGRDCKSIIGKILFRFFSLFAGVFGGFLKPNAYIIVIALLGVEGICFFAAVIRYCQAKKGSSAKEDGLNLAGGIRSAGAYLILSLFFASLFYGGTVLMKDHIVEAMDLEYNEEIEATPQYFFFMGTNETTTGSFSTEDYGIFGEFQYSKAERNAACMERAWERIKERGPIGTAYFCLKKLVKSFNDGTFAWTDVRYYQPFPEYLIHETEAAGYLRTFFIPDDINQAQYDTFAELIWIFILLGIPGLILIEKKKENYLIFPVFLAGLFIYLMLFESGARYLYIFLPVMVVMSVCGLDAMEKGISQERKRRR